MKLEKQDAFELVTPVVDGEAGEEESKVFFQYIDTHPDVRQYYEEELWLKKLVRDKVVYESAPDNLKDKVLHLIESLVEQDGKGSSVGPAEPLPGHEKRHQAGIIQKSIYALAAALVFSAFIYFNLFTGQESADMQAVQSGLLGLEEHVYNYFVSKEGKFIEPDIHEISVEKLQVKIYEHFGSNFSVPKLSDITLAGAVISEFLPDYHTPLFEYKVEEEDIIYIFAFHIPEMEQHLVRDSLAVDYCIRDDAYYIATIGDKDLVSWKWDDIWYVGISNHDGDAIASMLPYSD